MADFDTVELNWFFPNQIFGTHASADATYNMRNLVDQMEVDFSDDLSRENRTEHLILLEAELFHCRFHSDACGCLTGTSALS